MRYDQVPLGDLGIAPLNNANVFAFVNIISTRSGTRNDPNVHILVCASYYLHRKVTL